MKLKEKYLSTHFLLNFKAIKEDRVIKNFISFLASLTMSDNIDEVLKKYCDFVESLNSTSEKNLSEYLKNLVLISRKNIDDENQIRNEIDILKELSKIEYCDIKDELKRKYSQFDALIEKLPEYICGKAQIELEDTKVQKVYIDKLFEYNRAFIFDNDLEIKPVEINENLRFSDLKGYENHKKILYDNTKALLDGIKVNNILLYGDAGCGKSSSVRALLNEFNDIRIVQIFKKNLINLDKLYEKLKDVPLKFIIFADDISFDDEDNTFSTMKAVLEGSLIQCPSNAVIYATTNRRHLVRESFQSRMGDEIHLKDTMNEINSLSERFGITILFEKPTNEEFLDIVIKLARDNNIDLIEKHLIEKSQRLALIKGTRSPRIAKQLIDNLLAHVAI